MRENEPACQRFEISVEEENPNLVRLYEVYDEYKRDEWDRFNAEVSSWDLEKYSS